MSVIIDIDNYARRASSEGMKAGDMVLNSGSGVPADWHIDPVFLGVPGIRNTASDDDTKLSWQAESLCAQTDPEAFFPEKGGSTREAKRICGSCQVKSECLEYALEHDERYGIWGGLSERERRKLRKSAG